MRQSSIVFPYVKADELLQSADGVERIQIEPLVFECSRYAKQVCLKVQSCKSLKVRRLLLQLRHVGQMPQGLALKYVRSAKTLSEQQQQGT